jgi:hypothetical protein
MKNYSKKEKRSHLMALSSRKRTLRTKRSLRLPRYVTSFPQNAMLSLMAVRNSSHVVAETQFAR